MWITKVLLVLIVLVVIPIVSAVTVQEGDVEFNTTQSHTNYTNNLNLTTINITINKTGILFSEFHYVNGELGVNITDNVHMDEIDSLLNTTAMPFLLNSSNFTKNVSSFFNKELNATLHFDVLSCDNLTQYNYFAADGAPNYTIFRANITCVSDRAQTNVTNIQTAFPPNTNIITILYHVPTWQFATVLSLLGSMAFFFIASTHKKQRWLNVFVRGLIFSLVPFILLTIYFVTSIFTEGDISPVIERWYMYGVPMLTIYFYALFLLALGGIVWTLTNWQKIKLKLQN